ncbi:hypothetical protein L204_106104 [Cryptococcus depauperatus]
MPHTAPTIPRDGRLISLILASKGIEDVDERVIHQLLDFSRRYTADVLQSAQTLADHAARTGANSSKIEKDDIELAIKMRKLYEFFEAPPRDYLATLAHELNSQPLPILPESFDVIRLPPPHQRLTEVNFDIVPDSDLVLTDEGESEDESEEEIDLEEDDEEQINEDAEGEDEDMEEVGMESARPTPGLVELTVLTRQAAEVDEDYDM